jgi:hypothetical protein
VRSGRDWRELRRFGRTQVATRTPDSDDALKGFDLKCGDPKKPPEPVIASSLRTTAHPLHTSFATIFGASVAEPTLRPNPR